ncbi:hypothetical protein GNY06_04435 [Elizabethkingia argentiflava]|uniref:Uncharacterized protein n=1 Tax=Elizabethkingia argenteiflava TaxID=2681556 RepID=A0A845PR38_9FLAO|nr:hypothetical protein [Elizabethkingia argenteiflava]NAW50662.1 hypothetical protein [Elizabethkingia argenteiflava]
MTQKELKIEYDKCKNEFDTIKDEIEKQIVKVENYKGTFYEIEPFSYQRSGFKQGKLVENMNRIKKTNDLYIYGFNEDNKIVEVKEGIDIDNEYYYQFLFYEKNTLIKSLAFNNGKTLQNISYYTHIDDLLIKLYSVGRRGGIEEEYSYDQRGFLEKITIRQFDRSGNEASTLFHSFEYNSDGSLKSIIESAMGNDDYSEIIYSI